MKSDVKPVTSSQSNQVLFTGPTRLRGYSVQGAGTAGSVVINGLVNSTTVSSSLSTQVYLPIKVGANQVETLNLPEDGVLYAARNGSNIIDGIGITGNSAGLVVVLFIDK
jgi:hypothetical protein